MTRKRRSIAPRAAVIQGLRQRIHVHKHECGWYLVLSDVKLPICQDKERCIKAVRKRGDTVDQAV